MFVAIRASGFLALFLSVLDFRPSRRYLTFIKQPTIHYSLFPTHYSLEAIP
jgi:hypothetical protein